MAELALTLHTYSEVLTLIFKLYSDFISLDAATFLLLLPHPARSHPSIYISTCLPGPERAVYASLAKANSLLVPGACSSETVSSQLLRLFLHIPGI